MVTQIRIHAKNGVNVFHTYKSISDRTIAALKTETVAICKACKKM